MKNQLSMKRIWQDEYFFQIQMSFANDFLSVTSEIYMDNHLIDRLRDGIDDFLANKKENFLWEPGERGNDSTPCVEFNIFPKDALGHFVIEVFLEFEDGGDKTTHNCCFYIQTEYGLLKQFSSNLEKIKEPVLGTEILL